MRCDINSQEFPVWRLVGNAAYSVTGMPALDIEDLLPDLLNGTGVVHDFRSEDG